MATAPPGVVECRGIFGVSPSESTGQRMVALRYGDGVNMIGHVLKNGDWLRCPKPT